MHAPRRIFLALTIFACCCASACGDDRGTPDYSDQVGLIPPNIKFDEPDPYVLGKRRLSVDVFYEGDRSETIKINGLRNYFFIFGLAEFGRDSFSLVPAGERVEGEQSEQITLVGTSFWGGGIVWNEPIDLSEWKKLFVNFKSSDRSFASFDLTLLYGAGEMPDSVSFDVTDYGYTNDGEWHFLEIPLQDAIDRGFDPSVTRSPFIIGAGGGDPGDKLLVDNLYLTTF